MAHFPAFGLEQRSRVGHEQHLTGLADIEFDVLTRVGSHDYLDVRLHEFLEAGNSRTELVSTSGHGYDEVARIGGAAAIDDARIGISDLDLRGCNDSAGRIGNSSGNSALVGLRKGNRSRYDDESEKLGLPSRHRSPFPVGPRLLLWWFTSPPPGACLMAHSACKRKLSRILYQRVEAVNRGWLLWLHRWGSEIRDRCAVSRGFLGFDGTKPIGVSGAVMGPLRVCLGGSVSGSGSSHSVSASSSRRAFWRRSSSRRASLKERLVAAIMRCRRASRSSKEKLPKTWPREVFSWNELLWELTVN